MTIGKKGGLFLSCHNYLNSWSFGDDVTLENKGQVVDKKRTDQSEKTSEKQED